ncbi:hypothetical protein FOL47_010268, partial [Perkinsus chesapeaki]
MKLQQLPAQHLLLIAFGDLAGLIGGSTYESDIIERYHNFKEKYAISFDSMAEDAYRLEVFRKNVMFIEETNRRNLSYTLEVNQFAAMTQEEFARKMFSPSSSPQHFVDLRQSNRYEKPNKSLDDFPSDLNWVQKGAVNSPIQQGPCGSCYAIGTLGAVEAACWTKTKMLPRLSVQQILDCSREQGNFGCVKGKRKPALDYIIKYGIVSADDYPYEGKDQQCKEVAFDKTKQYLKPGDLSMKHLIRIGPGDLEGLFLQLQKGPIAIILDAETPEWRSYKGGILESFYCGRDPNHVVLLVGYGVENGKIYWTIRNSWGTDWGEGGYARIIRHPEVKKGA